MNSQVTYRLMKRKMSLAVEVPAISEQSRAWVGIYPRKMDEKFIVVEIEVERELLETYDENDVDLFAGLRSCQSSAGVVNPNAH